MHKVVLARSPGYDWRAARRRARRRVRRRILVAGAALVVCLIVVGVIARQRHHTQPVAVPKPVLAVQSRQPGFIHSGSAWTAAQTAQLRAEVAPIVNDIAFPPTSGVLIADARDGRVLYERDAGLALVPGSTIKLLTAAAALAALGPGYRFVTSLVSDSTPSDGRLAGNVWLVGGGDPELTSDDLRGGVHELGRHGVGSIDGGVFADGSRFGSDSINATWLPEDLPYGWAAPASAISIDGGSVQFTVTPQPGSDAIVAVEPPGFAEHVIASVSTVASDADNTLRIDVLPDGSGYQVSGQIPYGAPQKYWRSVPHPTRAAATSLLQMLRLAGINVGGAAGERRAPPGAQILWQHRSRPLYTIVQRMFFDSDNHIAEELLRSVGWKAYGVGTLPNALAAERSFFADQRLGAAAVTLADGSGLSAANKITAQLVASALESLARQPMPEEPYRLLPRAGLEGTVAVRELSPFALGRVFAKDGYIAGASGLAGFVLTAHHGPVIFVFLVNDWQHGLDAVWQGEDQVLDRLARY